MILILLSLFVIILLFVQNKNLSEILKNEKGLEVGEKAHIFRAKDLNEELVSIESKNALLIFFNSTCDACRITAPLWQELYDQYSSANILFIAISKETEEGTREFVSEHQLSLPVILDTSQKLRRKYKVKFFPQVAIVDRQGKIIYYQHYGTRASIAFAEAEKILKELHTS